MSGDHVRPTPPPKKKQKHSPSSEQNSESSRLFVQLSSLTSFLITLDTSQEPTILSKHLESVASILTEFDNLDRKKDEKPVKDELDRYGSEVWNISIKLHDTLMGIQPDKGWLRAFAILRRVGYQLILLGTVSPYSEQARIKLINLAIKTSLAFLALESSNDAQISASLLSQSATFIEPLLALPISELNESTEKVISNFYLTRLKSALAEENYELATFVREKSVSFAMGTRRYVTPLAKLALETGSKFVSFNPALETEEKLSAVDDKKVEIAIQWLLVASKLLEIQEGVEIKTLQIRVLENLAQAYLSKSNKSGWMKAESTLSALLEVAPTSAIWRRKIRLIIERAGTEEELVEAFGNSIKSMAFSQEEGTRLLGEVHRIPSDRRATKLSILDKLLQLSTTQLSTELGAVSEESSEIGDGVGGFIAICFIAFVISVGPKNLDLMTEALDRVHNAAPDFRLMPNPSFLIATYLWRHGDVAYAHKDKKLNLAAQWYLLGTHEIFDPLQESNRFKSFRKAALCLAETGKLQEADQVMERCVDKDCAKNNFVRFYIATMRKDEAQALQSLEAMSKSTDVDSQILLWAGKAAGESAGSSKIILSAVLKCILEIGKRDSNVIGIDLLLVIRVLLRQHISRLEGEATIPDVVFQLLDYLENALKLGKRLSKKDSAAIVKDIAWLHKTSYNLCNRLTKVWTTSQLIQLYSVTGSLAELSITLTTTPEPETLSASLHCRFAALAGQVHLARSAPEGVDRIAAFNSIIPPLEAMKVQMERDGFSVNGVQSIDQITFALLGLQIETYCAVNDWGKILARFQEIGNSNKSEEREAKLIKLITERCFMSGSTCPLPIAQTILSQAPVFLLSRHSVATGSMAGWLRSVVDFFLAKNLLDEALIHLEHSVKLLEGRPSKFPLDELSWLIATAWDRGVDYFCCADSIRALKCCEIALRAVKFQSGGLETTLSRHYEALSKKYSVT